MDRDHKEEGLSWDEEEKQFFHQALIKWFKEEGRELPWRRTQDPWAILVSEVMLQQTTVSAVLKNRRFELFLNQFPDVESMKNASEQELLKAWEGLGYYNRVRYLQKAAAAVVEQHGGEFPQELSALKALPGVGPYTAGALLSFAFDVVAPIVDTNIARVLSRIFEYQAPINTSAGQRYLWKRAQELLPRQDVRTYNSALMELGQRVCISREPQCQICPVVHSCGASQPKDLPVKKRGVKKTQVKEWAEFIRESSGRLILEQEEGNRRKGFWRLPRIEQEQVGGRIVQTKEVYSITRYQVSLFVYNGKEQAGNDQKGYQSFSEDELEVLPISSPERRVIERLLKS